jgi:uncharacterized protein YkwD
MPELGLTATSPSSELPGRAAVRRGGGVAVLIGLLIVFATACNVEPPAPTTTSLPDVAAAYGLLNQFRAQQGLGSLIRTAELDAKAQAQAEAMATAGQLFHSYLPAGLAPGWRCLGENIAFAPQVTSAQGWLEGSPPHRANMMNGSFNLVGIGVVRANGVVWVVQDFEQR